MKQKSILTAISCVYIAMYVLALFAFLSLFFLPSAIGFSFADCLQVAIYGISLVIAGIMTNGFYFLVKAAYLYIDKNEKQ